jgi:hypothetical protein
MNGAAVVGLTYRETDLQEDPLGLFLEIQKGLDEPPAFRGTDTLVPSRDFQIARNRRPHSRMILLEGYLYGDESDERADIRTRILDLFTGPSPLFDPRLVGELVATLENGQTATIDARTVNVLPGLIGPGVRRYSVELEANWGDWTYDEAPGS